jgi:glutamine cyclotransferase
LRFIDPATFRERRRVTVTDGGAPIKYVNELEWMKGEVLANVYTTDYIARINPENGRVTGWIDMRGLMLDKQIDVLNGIAYDAAGDRLFVTGKLWPKLFEIALVRRP